MWITITQRLFCNVVDVLYDLKWVGTVSGTLLLNNDLLIKRPRKWYNNHLCRWGHNQMRDSIEPCNAPPSVIHKSTAIGPDSANDMT